MIRRPSAFNIFEFAVLAGLRARQLARGCTPRVQESGKIAVSAQVEVAEGKVVRVTQWIPDGTAVGGDL